MLNACGSGQTAPTDETEVEAPEMACAYEAYARPVGVTVGVATLSGVNGTGRAIDTTTVVFELRDSDGDRIDDERATLITHWRAGERVAMQIGVLGEAPIPSAACHVVQVRPASLGPLTTFDADAATCDITRSEGPIDNLRAEVDIAAVSDAPDDTLLFGLAAVYDGDARVQDLSPTFDAGATTSGTLLSKLTGDDLTCELIVLRLP
jgi:hypothetical protein